MILIAAEEENDSLNVIEKATSQADIVIRSHCSY